MSKPSEWIREHGRDTRMSPLEVVVAYLDHAHGEATPPAETEEALLKRAHAREATEAMAKYKRDMTDEQVKNIARGLDMLKDDIDLGHDLSEVAGLRGELQKMNAFICQQAAELQECTERFTRIQYHAGFERRTYTDATPPAERVCDCGIGPGVGAKHSALCALRSNAPPAVAEVAGPSGGERGVYEFAEAILHGDSEHRRWLRNAAIEFIGGHAVSMPPKPLPRESEREPTVEHEVKVGSVWRDKGYLARTRKVFALGRRGQPITEDLTHSEDPDPYTWSYAAAFLESHEHVSDPQPESLPKPIDELIAASSLGDAASSLGDAESVAIRAQADPAIAARVLKPTDELSEVATLKQKLFSSDARDAEVVELKRERDGLLANVEWHREQYRLRSARTDAIERELLAIRAAIPQPKPIGGPRHCLEHGGYGFTSDCLACAAAIPATREETPK